MWLSRLEAVYHAAASSELKQGQEVFEAWYADADLSSDFAYCSALLEAVRSQERFRGTPDRRRARVAV